MFSNDSWVLFILAFFSLVSSDLGMTLSSTNRLGSSHLSSIIRSPHLGYVSNNSTLEIFIVGTSHFSCNSASEVNALISAVKPDGVVLELDPERVLRLTKQSCGIDASGNTSTKSGILYGQDFVAAIEACQKMDIPLFLGDEYVQDTKSRLVRRVWEADAYSAWPLIRSIFLKNANRTDFMHKRIDLLQTFLRDPTKLTPLIVSTYPPFVLALALFFSNNHAKAYDDVITSLLSSSSTNSFEIAISAGVTFLVSCFLFNNVIVERDVILTYNTVRASNVLRSLKQKRSIRRRWIFSVPQEPTNNLQTMIVSNDYRTPKDLPLFTLKTPIERGCIRNLNLFEPRWLKMIDGMKNVNSSNKELRLGCVRCTNKFYSALKINDGIEGRYADVIFDDIGNLATIVDIKEGTRPVSGDRRIIVSIVGGDSFMVDDSTLKVCEDGYMVVSDADMAVRCSENYASRSNQNVDEQQTVRIVVVVGLLHGNGVVELLLNNIRGT